MRVSRSGFGTRAAAIGNLFVKPAQSTPLADLKTRLIQMCKERDKPYGLLIRKLDFPFSGGNAEMQTLQHQFGEFRRLGAPGQPADSDVPRVPGWARRTDPRHALQGTFDALAARYSGGVGGDGGVRLHQQRSAFGAFRRGRLYRADVGDLPRTAVRRIGSGPSAGPVAKAAAGAASGPDRDTVRLPSCVC